MVTPNGHANWVAVVTGSTKGVGVGLAKRLGREGATVVVNGLSAADGRETVDNIREAGGEKSFVEADDAVLRPAWFTVFLNFFEAFMLELLFVPVVLGEELVEGAFVSSWKDFACDACHGLVAGND